MLRQLTAWRAVLVAGDDQEPAFDDAVDAMARKLTDFGIPRSNIAILKANGANEQEVRRGEWKVRDVQNIADVLVDPEGARAR